MLTSFIFKYWYFRCYLFNLILGVGNPAIGDRGVVTTVV
jgi:hypothetical protein